jgi:protein TonB
MTNGRFRIMLAHHRGPYKQSFALAVLVLFALFAFFPPFEFTPYALQAEEELEVVDVEVNIVIPPPPREVAPPPRVVEPYAGPEPGPEYPENVIENLLDVQPPRIAPGAAPFHAFDELPVPEFAARPVYPQLAREAGIEGTVLLKVLIGLDHKVRSAVVLSSDVTRAMEAAAIAAALQCRYKPAKQQNVEVEVWVPIQINFRLTD